MLVTICFAMMVSVSANDNVSLNNNLTGADQDVLENIDIDIKSGSPDDSNNGVASNVSSSSANKDKSTIDYLNKNKEKFDKIVKKSTKKDRTFKLGKYKLTISKSNYRKFFYVQFIDKYIKSGKNITLLEKIFKIKINEFNRLYVSGVTYLHFPAYGVIKKTNNIITLKIAQGADLKTKKIYFKEYKKAKKYNKRLSYYHKIKYDKKLKKYYVKVNIPIYKNIKCKKARVYIRLEYLNNEFELTTYTKYDIYYNPNAIVVRDYTIYKSSKNIKKLNKSKTKRCY